MSKKDAPASFAAMCSALHQDAVVLHGGSWEDLADDCIGCVLQERRAELAAFLKGLLARRDNSELRRVLRKHEHIALAMPREGWWSLFEVICARLAV